MRILFINTLYPPHVGGGAEITLSTLVNGMAKRGYEVAVLTTQNEKGLKVTRENDVTVFRAGIRNIYWHFTSSTPPSWKRLMWHAFDSYNPLAARDVKNVINKFKPDVVSCHNLPGFSASAWRASASAKIPTIQVLHDYYSICPKNTLFNHGRNCQKPCASCSTFRLPHPSASNQLQAVVGVSKAVLDRHLEAGLFVNVPVKQVIYNARSLNSTESPTKPSSDILTFGFIGSLTVVKGIDKLIEAFIRISGQTQRKLKLLIGGVGKDDYVHELKQRFGGHDNIVFLGKVDPAHFFSQVDITVVPSVWNEPLGMVVPESLGFNVPVIGAKRGGIPEMVQHEKNGLVYDPDELLALDKAMLKLIEDTALLQKMRENAASSVTRFLNENLMLDEHETLYKKVAKNG